jgi:hypothetical protein
MPNAYAFEINCTTFPPACNFPTVASFINTLMPNIFVLSGVIFLVMFIMAGFQYISKAGSGDAEGIKKAQSIMAAAAVGLLLIFVAYWIVRIISLVTGVDMTSPGTP